jgi:hypothetical protein
MKKLLLFGIGCVFGFGAMAQTFTDNFDSYTANQKLCPQSGGAWTTWSNAPGGTEDVMVVNSDAASAPNSLRFTSTVQTGGPTDLVRHFGVLNTGQFSLEFNMKVLTGKAAYFNLQKTATMGNTYALDAFFEDDGTLFFNQVAGFSTTYPQNTWFNFRLEINFNINKWEVFIDGVSQGYWSNTVNQIEAIDIFPVDNNTPYGSDFYLDDFQTIITPYTLPALNAAVSYAGFNGGNIATNSVTPTFKVRNLGTTPITSFDITVDYNGVPVNQSFTGLNMASLAEQSFTLSTPFVLVPGANAMTFTVSNPNGAGTDDDTADDISILMVDPVVPALGKMVVGEEATGTWCQWCPRGSVYMDLYENNYMDFWAGIAVHNGDPMTDPTYDTGIGGLIGGYPSALVDRLPEVDPSGMANNFFSRLQTPPTAFILNGATWDAGTRTLNVSVSADFQAAANNNYKIACVLTEDSVTGSGPGWSQSNAYSGGGSGVMGGFESLPNPVPAAQMVYNHVARSIAPSFGGFAGSFPATVNSGDVHTVNFSFVLPASWDETQMHIIGMLIAPNGTIDNAGKATIAEAVANGYVSGTSAGLSELSADQLDAVFKIHPNPASDFAVVTIQLDKDSDVSMKITDMSGKEIASRNYGSMNGAQEVVLDTQKLNAGVYMVELTVNGSKMTKRLVVE